MHKLLYDKHLYHKCLIKLFIRTRIKKNCIKTTRRVNAWELIMRTKGTYVHKSHSILGQIVLNNYISRSCQFCKLDCNLLALHVCDPYHSDCQLQSPKPIQNVWQFWILTYKNSHVLLDGDTTMNVKLPSSTTSLSHFNLNVQVSRC